jgi:hypothetical protein
MNNKLIQIAQIAYQIVRNCDKQVEDAILARAIGTMIFDIPTTRSGLVSVGLLDKYGYRPSVSKCTEEHFHSRNESGYRIIELVRDGGDENDVINFLEKATMVHLTTKAENIRLSAIQNHCTTKNLSWQEQYELAGIELVEDPKTMPVKMQNKLKKM